VDIVGCILHFRSIQFYLTACNSFLPVVPIFGLLLCFFSLTETGLESHAAVLYATLACSLQFVSLVILLKHC